MIASQECANWKTNSIMVEVFKTNVEESVHACMLVDQIHKTFKNYKANFDLEDCDKILRVECTTGDIYIP